MGLDMYLSKRIYVGARYDHRKVKAKVKISVYGLPLPINEKRIDYIIEESCYWRKANAIHKWFVDNCQQGVDDCREYVVETEKIQELVNICKKIIKTKNKDHSVQRLVIEKYLPFAKEGFVFGSKEIDTYFFDCLEYTIKTLQNELDSIKSYPEASYVEFIYRSSW